MSANCSNQFMLTNTKEIKDRSESNFSESSSSCDLKSAIKPGATEITPLNSFYGLQLASFNLKPLDSLYIRQLSRQPQILKLEPKEDN
jgi:hypothetical protein